MQGTTVPAPKMKYMNKKIVFTVVKGNNTATIGCTINNTHYYWDKCKGFIIKTKNKCSNGFLL